MVERNGYSDGEPCWADITTAGVEAAKRFYGDLLGWTFEESGPEYGGYVSCLKNGKRVAGISPPQPGADFPTAWSLYLWSHDVAATAKSIEQGGGRLMMEPMEVPEMGRMAFAFDPGGAAFGVWEPLGHRGSQLFGEPGALAWAELNGRDPGTIDPFYQNLFGYEAEQVGDGQTFDYVVWKLEGQPVAGRQKMTEQWGDTPPHWNVYFAVDDADVAAQRVTAAGGQVREQPFDSAYGRITVVTDPNGAIVSLIDTSKATAA
jgi:predicted enzyme related to lactoylglutathione lyase